MMLATKPQQAQKSLSKVRSIQKEEQSVWKVANFHEWNNITMLKG
jgi:hypothetical protein